MAVALDGSILTQSEIASSGLPNAGHATSTAGGRSLPQGALTFDGIVAVLPQVGAYRTALTQGKATVGANHTYLAPSPQVVVDVLAIKFETAQSGSAFAQTGALLVKAGGGVTTAHPEVHLGVLDAGVTRIAPAAGASSQAETVVSAVLYPNGVYYLVTTQAAAGAVTDAQILGLLTGQDAKYQANKAQLGIT